MLEHLNIQAIAKWFEKGCDSADGELVGNKSGEKGFYFLECDDICLLSKLTDVKNKTLLDRAHKRLKKIKDPISRKDFLLAISNEFLRDGRKLISLKMVNSEIDNETELYKLFKSDLLFHRALCYFKLEKATEALCDLYSALEGTKIQNLDRIHVQILEELKKYLKKDKISEECIVIKDCFQITFKEILKQYETEICRFIEQQMEKQQLQEEEKQNVEWQQQRHHQTQYREESISAYGQNCESKSSGDNQTTFTEMNQARKKISKLHQRSELMTEPRQKPSAMAAATADPGMGLRNKFAVTGLNATGNINTIPRKLIKKRFTNNDGSDGGGGGGGYGHGSQKMVPAAVGSLAMVGPAAFSNHGELSPPLTFGSKFNVSVQTIPIYWKKPLMDLWEPTPPPPHRPTLDPKKFNNNNNNNNAIVPPVRKPRELNITYSVDNRKQISVKQILNEPIIDNIFNLRGILVDNLCDHYKINTIYEIFETFGTIINIKQKDNSNKLIIEYDNTDSPRFAISYLSQVELPFVSQNNKYLEFRYFKSENQKNFRICKQNQIKTSRECYFWRTTGCQNGHCKFYHNRLAKGVDYQEWMKIDPAYNQANGNGNGSRRGHVTSSITGSRTSETMVTNKMAYTRNAPDQNRTII